MYSAVLLTTFIRYANITWVCRSSKCMNRMKRKNKYSVYNIITVFQAEQPRTCSGVDRRWPGGCSLFCFDVSASALLGDSVASLSPV